MPGVYRDSTIPLSTLRRLPAYIRIFRPMLSQGRQEASAERIARDANLYVSMVKEDLNRCRASERSEAD